MNGDLLLVPKLNTKHTYDLKPCKSPSKTTNAEIELISHLHVLSKDNNYRSGFPNRLRYPTVTSLQATIDQ